MKTAQTCRAKNSATCRVHGKKFNASTGQFSSRRPLEEHQAESEKFKFLLNSKQKAAIDSYLDQDYMELTPVLYGKDHDDAEVLKEKAALMDEALNSYEAIADRKSKVVYRATKLDSNGSFTTMEEVSAYTAKKFPVGKTFTVPGFLSTTENPEALFDFIPDGYADYAAQPKGKFSGNIASLKEYIEVVGQDNSLNNVVYEIVTPSGAPVSSFGHTHAEKEQEYLLGRNKTFKITEVVPFTQLHNPVESWVRSSAHATVVRMVEVTK